MKRILLTSLILFAAFLLNGQSVHFGTTAVSGEDEFKSYYSEEVNTGSYLGASNSFPVNTVVTVTNPGNGKTVSVTIVKRLSQPGLFLVLSPEAGKAISFPENDVLDLQVVEKRKNDDVFTSYAEDRAFSRDPDLNPSAELTGKETDPKVVDTAETVKAESPVEVGKNESVEKTDTDSKENLIADVSEIQSSPNKDASDTEIVVKEPETAINPPEANIDEYIPPVVMNSEGTAFEDGYDPLVLLKKEENGPAKEESVSPDEVPLPQEFDDQDLPEFYQQERSDGDNKKPTAEKKSPVILDKPEVALGSEELDSELLDPTVDDLLISETAEEETSKSGNVLSDLTVSEPSVGDIPENVRETIVMVPDEEMKPEKLDTTVFNEPYVDVPAVKKEDPPVIYTFDGEEDSNLVLADDTSVIEPLETVENKGAETPVIIEALSDEQEVVDKTTLDDSVSEPVTPEVPMEEDVVALVDKEADKKVKEKEKAPEIVDEVIVNLPKEEPKEQKPVEKPPENVIYFLTPGDFRPPPASPEKKEKEKSVKPKLVERRELEDMIVKELHNGGSYLQLGTYSSIDVLYSTIKSLDGSYPSIVLTMGDGENQLYKLLIGPITRDEKGLITTRFRSLGFGDAFLYSSH